MHTRHESHGALNKWAQNIVTLEPCVQKVRNFVGIYEGKDYIFFKYIFRNGRVLEEKVQATPRPAILLALVDEDGKWIPESLWSKEDFVDA